MSALLTITSTFLVGARQRQQPRWSVGDGGFPIQIGGGFLYNTYPDVSCIYPACILHVFRCVLFIKIHQDTSRYICICHFGYDDGIETFPQPPRYVS